MSGDIVTLWDGRKGYFYTSHFAGNPIFQPVDADGLAKGNSELADAEDHELLEEGNEDGSNRDVPPYDNDPRSDEQIKQAVYNRFARGEQDDDYGEEDR